MVIIIIRCKIIATKLRTTNMVIVSQKKKKNKKIK